MSVQKKRGLGRGLDALLSTASSDAENADAGEILREIALDRVQPGAHQPRRHFDAEALDELASSIAAQGVVQPIVVRPLADDRYEIVAGERRWRAAGQAGLKTVPAVVRNLDERGAMAVALVENIQRADLNPLEEAEALQRLIAQCRLTHEQVAEAVGRSRAAVSNLLRLIELAPELQQWVRERRLSLGHAKVLLGVPAERRAAIATQIVEGQLSVRQTEALCKSPPGPAAVPSPRAMPASTPPELQQRAARCIGLPVRLRQDASGRGQITIRFGNDAELQQFLARLG